MTFSGRSSSSACPSASAISTSADRPLSGAEDLCGATAPGRVRLGHCSEPFFGPHQPGDGRSASSTMMGGWRFRGPGGAGRSAPAPRVALRLAVPYRGALSDATGHGHRGPRGPCAGARAGTQAGSGRDDGDRGQRLAVEPGTRWPAESPSCGESDRPAPYLYADTLIVTGRLPPGTWRRLTTSSDPIGRVIAEDGLPMARVGITPERRSLQLRPTGWTGEAHLRPALSARHRIPAGDGDRGMVSAGSDRLPQPG